ncbi:MAG: M13 family metallopeptidase [Alphaproteobacteria bacterium]|nr:M13 family metallopeptidase [Alphaproteobacteria bacterium]MBV9692781.1 M13 family metallopeptidase [Alphaproteobacteria bacterium]
MRRTLMALLGASAVITAAYSDAPKTQYGTWGFDIAAMDRSVRPGDNFFKFANGNWYKTAVIPPDRASTGSFQDLRILSEKRMQEIAASLDARPYDQLDGEGKKLRDLYDAFLDQKQIDANGLKPAQRDLATIAHLKTLDQVAAAMGDPMLSLDGPIGYGFGINEKNPGAYAIDLGQSGLGMPDRDYYLRDDAELAKTRDAYKKHLATVFTMVGLSDPDKRAAAVYDVEYKMAQADWPNADRRDEDKVYNPMTYAELKALAPQFPWDAYFAKGGVSFSPQRQVIVAEKSAFPKLAAIFAETPVAVWRDYLTAHYIHTYAAYLPQKFDDENFAFYGTVLQGNSQQLPRGARAAHLLDGTMGEALGKLYVAKYFPPQAKAKAEELVHNLLKAYEADIKTLSWMTPATREKAEDKIHRFTIKIGYPDTWRDYSALVIKRDDLLGDIQRANLFEWERQAKRVDQPADKTEWGMTPPTVNAYNNSQWNEIVFPAAILQPPFFDPNADDAVNYGGIGAVIGHEISHGFDDQGSKFDSLGRLENWWTPEDRKVFESKTAALGKQYDSYEPLPGLHINGAFTMGENVADNAGIAIALKAYHISLAGHAAPVLDGFTGDQRYYLSYGQIWRAKIRDGAMRQQVLSNEHSPAEFRAIGATRNQDEWYAAFGVKPGDKYYLAPDQRVHLW